ncbi:hypothetical protein CKAH01_18861 [Colletotrichum kahawae]|uniref:Uncharacterized protein n=1 Tax=Colletotrichum kahawae TaxID=34407 RepID=A0AAE0D1C4_COLKA|nr:hypothetical protein CKAH01_18861 [Colletotrichum kahawae]
MQFLEDISLTFDDYESESELDTHKNDANFKAQSSIPDTEPDFSWDFVPRPDIPLGNVDMSFEKWPGNRRSSNARHYRLHLSPTFLLLRLRFTGIFKTFHIH